MKRFINSVLICLISVGAWAADQTQAPQKPAQKDMPACFAEWDNKLLTLQTDFTQTTEYDGLLISQSQGSISYLKAGSKLRLDNKDGQTITQTALTNKITIWILDEKGKEISTLSWQDWLLGQPNQALFDFGNYTQLLNKHDVSVLEYKDETAVLRLTPKNKAENYILYVAVSEKNCFPQSITIQADLMKTTAALTQTRLNAELNKDLFKGIK